MRILSKESFSVVQPLMSENYANLYSRLSLQLPPELAGCFARYTMLPAHNAGQWSIDRVDEDDFKPISQATPLQRMAAADRLQALSEAISRSGVVREPNKLLSVPDDACIFFRQNPDVSVDIVFTQWGYRKIGSASSVDNIALLINGNDKRERADVNLRILWSDDLPVEDTQAKINIYGSSFERTTDRNGVIHLGSVAAGETVTVEIEGQLATKLNIDTASHDYVITLPYHVDATITCIDSNDKPVQTTINIDGTPHTTDAEGVCKLHDILMKNDTELNVDFNGHNNTRFRLNHDRDRNNFMFQIPAPPPIAEKEDDINTPPPISEEMTPEDIDNKLNVSIRIVDKKGRPMTFATFNVLLRKGSRTAVSDADGFIRIPRTAFTQGEKVKVKLLPDAPKKIPVSKPAPQVPPTPEQTGSLPPLPKQECRPTPPPVK